VPRYQFTVVMPNLNYDLSQDFEENETMSEVTSKSMSESMSELERTRMQITSRLLSKAAKLDILKSYGKTKNKVYFKD
jgi:ATP-dependent DNA helicase RecG